MIAELFKYAIINYNSNLEIVKFEVNMPNGGTRFETFNETSKLVLKNWAVIHYNKKTRDFIL